MRDKYCDGPCTHINNISGDCFHGFRLGGRLALIKRTTELWPGPVAPGYAVALQYRAE